MCPFRAACWFYSRFSHRYCEQCTQLCYARSQLRTLFPVIRGFVQYDAVIAGAGPVGLLLACELGLAGVRTLVLERLSDPDIPTRGPGLGGRALNIPSMEALYRRGM